MRVSTTTSLRNKARFILKYNVLFAFRSHLLIFAFDGISVTDGSTWLEKVRNWGTWFPGNFVIWREVYEFETKKYK